MVHPAVATAKYVKRGTLTVTGPTSYPTGGFTVNITRVEKVIRAIPKARGDIRIEVAGITNNVVTLIARGVSKTVTHDACPASGAVYSTATTLATVDRDMGTEVAAGTDLSGLSIDIDWEGV